MVQRWRFKTIHYHVLNDNHHHKSTFFYYVTENWLQIGSYFYLLRQKTIGTILIMFGCSRVNYWVCKFFTVLSLVFHLPPVCFLFPLFFSISTWVLEIDLFIVPWKALCIPTFESLHLPVPPYESHPYLPLCGSFKDHHSYKAAQLAALILSSLSCPKYLLEHIRLPCSLDCLWRLSFCIYLSLVPSTKKIIHLFWVWTIHFSFLPFFFTLKKAYAW